MANSLNIQQDFNQIACLQLTLPNLASAPSSPVEGEEYYNTVSKIAYFYNGTSWVAMSGGGGGSSAFNDITSGTNTTAAMVVGSGASLATSGTGTIAATTVVTNANLTGDVTSSGNATTIANSAVTNAKMANMAASTFKMRVTGSTGAPEDGTATQATAALNAMVGDSGSGGTKGLVPAPAAGDAAAGKYLKADGTWATVSGGGSTLVLDETPSGTINGSNVTFTLASSPSSTVELTMYDSTNGGGIPLLYGVDYTVTGSTITMTAAPLTGSTLRANYGTGAVAAGLTLLGDVTGSGTSSITTTIRNDVDLPGSPTTTTQSVGDNSTKIATTAYVDNYAIPTGTIVTAFDSEDSFMVSKGFLKCDQTLRTVSQATYANLYAKIGLLNPIGSDFSIPATVTGNMTSIAASDSVYVYCSGTSIYSTTDLITWTSRTSNATGSLLSGWYQGSLFCFVGASGNIITSSDGSTWALRTSGTANQLNRIRYYNSLWLTVGASGTFLTASDPTASWTPRSTGSALNLNGVAYGNGIYVLTSSTGQSIITSPDLSTFTTRSIALQLGTSVLTDIYFANGIFVATGNNGTILTSTNGINWVRRLAFTVGNNLAILWSSARSCFVIAVNGEPSALISADGIRWQQVYVPYVVGVFSIAINSTKMVIGNGSYPIVCSVSYPYDNTTLFQLPIMSTRLPFNCGTPINYYIKT